MTRRCFACGWKNKGWRANCWNCNKSLEKGTGYKMWWPGTRSIDWRGAKYEDWTTKPKEESKAESKEQIEQQIRVAEQKLNLLKHQLSQFESKKL